MKIGYQGIIGSNSEEAAHILANKLKLENVEYIPLITSKNVIKSLENGEIEYGVCATRNYYAGEVEETKKAIEESKIKLKILDKIDVPIHHSIFKKNNKIKNEDLTQIASHVQALLQTKEFRKKNLPNLKELEVEDTALAAKYLAEGELPETTAIVSRKNAGEMYNLELMYENIEDLKNNLTEFAIYVKA